MTRKSKGWTDNKLQNRIRQGRGQGENDYKPWLKVSDTPSLGRVTRIFSKKMNRTIHLLSDLQTMTFYQLEFDDLVENVKEQYPLLDLVDIIGHLDEPLLKRLSNSDGTPHIIVTTFFITAKDHEGKSYTYARSVKTKAELGKKAVFERLELQRRYFANLNIDWAIITEDEINYTKSRNIEWVLPALNITDYGMAKEEVRYYGEVLLNDLLVNPSISVKTLINSFERECRLSDGMGLFLFRYLIASKQIKVNMDEEINLMDNPEKMRLTVGD